MKNFNSFRSFPATPSRYRPEPVPILGRHPVRLPDGRVVGWLLDGADGTRWLVRPARPQHFWRGSASQPQPGWAWDESLRSYLLSTNLVAVWCQLSHRRAAVYLTDAIASRPHWLTLDAGHGRQILIPLSAFQLAFYDGTRRWEDLPALADRLDWQQAAPPTTGTERQLPLRLD